LTYQALMKNIQLFSKLFKFLFHEINETLGIKPSQLLNMVDTTLIEEKNQILFIKKIGILVGLLPESIKFTKIKYILAVAKAWFFSIDKDKFILLI